MTTAVDDELWSAIGDPMRRRLVDLLLAAGEGTATTLGAQLPISRQAVTKHLGVLDRVGMVHATPEGRERLVLGHESFGRVRTAPEGSGFNVGDLVVEAGLMSREEVDKQLSPARLSGLETITQAIPIVQPAENVVEG